MKVPVSWLKEWVPVKTGAEEIAKRLTFAGLEVEGIQTLEGEPVLEVNVTPNRGDCLSIRGIAREVGALFQKPLKRPLQRKSQPSSKKSPVSVSILRPKACPRYALAVIEDVKIGPSPQWLVRRLSQTGVRSVNNVVDVTNYILMELGHPLHAFDRAKIRGDRIVVRDAKDGEVLKTLDGVDRKLSRDDLVIADAEGPVALAGVMGGSFSEVGSGTTSIALECAFFEPSAVRSTSRRLGLASESSYRFERRVDPEGIPDALQRAAALMVELTGGRVTSFLDRTPVPQTVPSLRLRSGDVSEILGGEWKESDIRSALRRLGFEVREGGKGEWRVKVPSYRGDISRPVDLIEEIARVHGLDRVPETFPALRAPVPAGASFSAERQAKSLLADLGLQETVHNSFISEELASSLGERATVVLANPLTREESVLRPSLLPSLLAAASRHARHKMETLRIFELRNVFLPDNERPAEKKKLAGLLMGAGLQAHWSRGSIEADFYDLKGLVEAILRLLNLESGASFSKGSALYLHPGRQARLTIEGRETGVLGEAHPDLLHSFDLKKPAWVFELDWGALTGAALTALKFVDYPRLPVVERDLAVVVEEGIEAGALLDFIRRRDPVISEARVFDLYRGDQVAAGKKSLAFSIRMSRSDRTMTEEEVGAVFQNVMEGIKSTFGAEIR